MICEVSGAKERLTLLTVIPISDHLWYRKGSHKDLQGSGSLAGKNQAWTVAEADIPKKISSKHHFLGIGQPGKEDGLEVLGMSRRFWNAHLWEYICTLTILFVERHIYGRIFYILIFVTCFFPSSELIKLDLPTLGWPRVPTVSTFFSSS